MAHFFARPMQHHGGGMFARDAYLRKMFSMALVSTHKMMADMMNKVVDREKFLKCRDYALGGD